VEVQHRGVDAVAREISAAARQFVVITPVAMMAMRAPRARRSGIAVPIAKPASARLTTGSPPLAMRI
jgi:hypothetical protein